jgi:Ca2+-binding EF-hand superfamily protein
MGLSDIDGDGNVPYMQFTDICVKYIKDNFQFNQLIRKKELFEMNKATITATHPACKDLDEMELFRTFKKYDRNMNGTLEF